MFEKEKCEKGIKIIESAERIKDRRNTGFKHGYYKINKTKSKEKLRF